MTPAATSPLGKLLRRMVAYAVLSAAGLSAIAFAGDYCVFRIRLASNRRPFGSVTVTRYYAVPMKNGKVQFIFDPPGPQTCANTLFPQGGFAPCWYVMRHTEQRIDM